MNEFGNSRSFNIIFIIAAIIIGLSILAVLAYYVVVVVIGVQVLQHPADAGNWVRDLIAPVVQEIKK